MNMKSALLVLVACCLVTGAMSAQSNRTRPRAKPAMWTAVQLTETQKTQVKTIHQKYASVMKFAQKQSRDSGSKIYDREMTEVRDVLTFSQQQTFDSFMNGKQRARVGSAGKAMPAKISVPR